MKITPLIAIAALSSVASLAQAQSSVEVFGVLDLAYLNTRASGSGSQSSLTTDGNTSSRLGFRGTEDLGDGLNANFWLEAAVTPDSGVGGGTSSNNVDSINTGGLTFGRRSTVGLTGRFGDIRLGRDYTPTFTSLASATPFGTNGLGNAGQMFYPKAAGGTTARTNVRASNAINYFLPSGLGGFTGNVMYAMGEQASNAVGGTSKNGNYFGARLGYSAGPLNLALATGKTTYATGDYTQSNLAANYAFGPAKLMYLWGQNKVGVTKTTANMIGTQYTLGQGEIRFSYTMVKAEGVANDANQWALGYVYNLSKRTALYTAVSQVKNKGIGKAYSVGDGVAVTDAGGSSSGVQFGVRHSF